MPSVALSLGVDFGQTSHHGDTVSMLRSAPRRAATAAAFHRLPGGVIYIAALMLPRDLVARRHYRLRYLLDFIHHWRDLPVRVFSPCPSPTCACRLYSPSPATPRRAHGACPALQHVTRRCAEGCTISPHGTGISPLLCVLPPTTL